MLQLPKDHFALSSQNKSLKTFKIIKLQHGLNSEISPKK